jgi:hypothetical protein|tara:strand:+ start:282 stop:476 length:195 start_codon:yes stop_codon:yes gene_type:complete
MEIIKIYFWFAFALLYTIVGIEVASFVETMEFQYMTFKDIVAMIVSTLFVAVGMFALAINVIWR